jgi:hypothetical protein
MLNGVGVGDDDAEGVADGEGWVGDAAETQPATVTAAASDAAATEIKARRTAFCPPAQKTCEARA